MNILLLHFPLSIYLSIKKATFAASTTLAGTAVSASVVSACSNVVCTPSATVLCSLVANTNQVLGCYVGVYYQSTSTTTMIASICAPISSASAAYCVVSHYKHWKTKSFFPKVLIILYKEHICMVIIEWLHNYWFMCSLMHR